MFEFSEVTNDCAVYTGIATLSTLPSQFSVPRVVYKGKTNCQRSGYTFFEDGNLCINVVEKKMIWDKANQTCEQEDGRLLVLTSPTKINGAFKYFNIYNKVLMQQQSQRFGILSKRQWKWIDGTSFETQMWSEAVFNNFDANHPSMRSADCAVLGVSKMFDVYCNNPRKFICERPQLV
ncbi:LOW QUALITY PROTEIN: asialoglycoprotein receptor 2-like [Ylistrum balloti]|uniref:LOW QUALITY PROTEIN: asialoglycoprotein receptor 2-like n=1 Tax=Ylistrum balloti TaxID=509963 RepID=UPI002905932F|nr:LOW QUALITY PROTEIN: asialoglycoprotein receptor 2-like [Ylistrum balloti]